MRPTITEKQTQNKHDKHLEKDAVCHKEISLNLIKENKILSTYKHILSKQGKRVLFM